MLVGIKFCVCVYWAVGHKPGLTMLHVDPIASTTTPIMDRIELFTRLMFLDQYQCYTLSLPLSLLHQYYCLETRNENLESPEPGNRD